jgi:hypothetical protein
MTELYRLYGEQMYFFEPYIGFRVMDSKLTDTGFHEPKIEITVGRRLKEPTSIKLSNIPTSVIESYRNETGINIESLGWFTKFKMYLANKFLKMAKVLGMTIEEKDTSWEIYEYVKFNSTEELSKVMSGMGLLSSALIKLKNENYNEKQTQLINSFKEGMEIGLKR